MHLKTATGKIKGKKGRRRHGEKIIGESGKVTCADLLERRSRFEERQDYS